MEIFWTAWTPELFFRSALTVLLVSGVFLEATPKREHRLNFSPNLISQPKGASSGASVDFLQKENPTGPFGDASLAAFWSVRICVLTGFLLWSNPVSTTQLSGVFIRTEFTTNRTLFLLALTSLTFLVSQSWFRQAGVFSSEYSLLVRRSLLGQWLMVQSTDLMSFYLSLELQSFCFIVLCSLDHSSLFSVEAGMKYFLLSAFASCFLRFGIAILYWSTGQTSPATFLERFDLTPSAMHSPSVFFGIWLISLGLLWKLAAAPFHMWAIDVYQGSLSSVTLLLALAPKRSILGFWMHQWQSIWNQSFLNAILWFSALSMVIGAFGAFSQVHLKRFLAYSSVGNMGILRMAFGSGSGAEAALWTHFALYALTSLAVWGILMLPFIRQGKVYSNPTYLWDFAVLWKTHPMTAWTFGLAMTSLAGLPPLAGFLGKLGIFWWSLNSGQYALLAVALTTTLIGSVYYLRLRRIMYMDQPKEWTVAGVPSTSAAYVIAFSGLSLIVLRWYSSPVLRATHWLSLSLFCV